MRYRGNVLAYVGNCYHQAYRGEYVGYNDAPRPGTRFA